ncbi:hypothetical protein D9615_005901 [Tricholomella constricta]|uniref:Mug135-like C-terminal domain-containing protein n=1 Tax=Tricholomella constricta TaxID=117010 RepID=A0A8H5M2T2_9AGAR|nr:hypothetical protein D9615_005901 [Tricholomella constricta]
MISWWNEDEGIVEAKPNELKLAVQALRYDVTSPFFNPMPVPLPNPPAANAVLPPHPQDPAILQDIANAIEYNRVIRATQMPTGDQVGAGAVYEAALIAQHAGGAVAPPWFAPALAAGLAPLMRTAHINYNLCAGDGHSRRFQVVPFLDGTLPTGPPHNLPPLVNLQVVNTLTGPQATAYLQGYGQPVPNGIAARRRAICDAVGCDVTR